jgi:microcystin-dependent protein
MSNYTLAVAWSGKDALSDSDADKVISGADFNTEFTTVQTAINTKADVNGSATESFSATTATAGTNTTQVATTAFVTTAIAAIPSSFPIGSIFTTVTAYANSAAVVAVIGGTTWVSFAAGKMIMGVDTGDTDFDTVEETGGAKTHTLTTAEMPAHTHSMNGRAYNISIHDIVGTVLEPYNTSHGSAQTPTTNSTGGGNAHSIMNPYITVYMWKRTA